MSVGAALAKMISCKTEAPMAMVLGSQKATFFKIRPLRINLMAVARMILWKTDAPMGRDQESPKAKFLKIRPFRII